MPALGTAHTSEPLAQVAAFQVVVHGLRDDRTPEAVLVLKPVGKDALELLVMLLHEAIQGRLPRLARAIEPSIVMTWKIHDASQQRARMQISYGD